MLGDGYPNFATTSKLERKHIALYLEIKSTEQHSPEVIQHQPQQQRGSQASEADGSPGINTPKKAVYLFIYYDSKTRLP